MVPQAPGRPPWRWLCKNNLIGVYCSLPELERREIQRGDRRLGEARQDFETVHSIPTYDLEIDSEQSLDGNVTRLIQAWQSRKHPSALDKMIEEMKK